MVKTYFKTVRRMFKNILYGFFSYRHHPYIHRLYIGYRFADRYDKGQHRELLYKTKRKRLYREKQDGRFYRRANFRGKNRYGENNVETGMSLDIQTGEKRSLRLYFSTLKIPESTSWNSSKAKR